MNSSQVRGKARAAMTKRYDEIEEEEIQGGEINLVPYLDIVTNLMLFLLASVSSGFILGQIDTTLPDHAPANTMPAVDPEKKPDEQPLQLTVSVTQNQIILWSVSGLEGTLAEPKLRLNLLPPKETGDAPSFEYLKLNATLKEIADRRWKGKLRPHNTYEILLQADGAIPYETVITTMDHMRRILPEQDLDPSKRTVLPYVGMPAFTKATTAKDKDTPTEAYDSTKHFLFIDVLFAKPSFD